MRTSAHYFDNSKHRCPWGRYSGFKGVSYAGLYSEINLTHVQLVETLQQIFHFEDSFSANWISIKAVGGPWSEGKFRVFSSKFMEGRLNKPYKLECRGKLICNVCVNTRYRTKIQVKPAPRQ